MTEAHNAGNPIAQTGIWTAESVGAFWDYHGQKTPPGGYFSEVLAEGLINIAAWTGNLAGNASVVDFGCGRGPLIDALLKREYQAGGVEFSPDSAAIVDGRFQNHDRYLGTQVIGHPAPWHNVQFDTAFCIEVVEHLTDEFLKPSLETLASLIKPGGAVVVTTPYDEKLAEHLVFCPFCRTEFHHMQHVRSWTVESLSAALGDAGLSVELCQPMQLSRFCYGRPAGRRDILVSRMRSAIRDTLATFSGSAAFRYAAKPGDNLVAIARRPSD